ncbi:MAG: hypothetical protein ACOZIN_01890, partial [Myxococcota bacterium]
MRTLVALVPVLVLSYAPSALAQEEIPDVATPPSAVGSEEGEGVRGARRPITKKDRDDALKAEEERKKAEAEAKAKAEAEA